MAVDDLWYSSKRVKGPDGKLLPPETTRRHGRGKRYRVRWIDDTGQPQTRLFDRKADADRHDANVRADVSQGRYVDPRAGQITVAEYAAKWRKDLLTRESTDQLMERTFRLHIVPILGRQQLGQVRTSHLKGWVKDRAAELAPTTVRVVYGYLVAMFAAAVLDRLIGASPCTGAVSLPDIPDRDLVIPTPDQVHALADALPARYRVMPYLAAGCGLRLGEVLGLELGDVGFLRREVDVARQLICVSGRKPYLGPLKTKTSRRTAELGAVVCEALARHVAEYPPVDVEIDDETDPRRPVRRTAKLLITNGKGEPPYKSSWGHTWSPARVAVGLPDRFGIHGLRHYYASLLIHAGASVKTVQLALGHSTPTITLNTYVHLWPEAVDRTRSLVDAALGRPARGLAAVR